MANMTIGAKIAEKRRQLKRPQELPAERLDVSYHAVSDQMTCTSP